MRTQGLDVREVRDAQTSRLIIEGKDGVQILRESSKLMDKDRKSIIQQQSERFLMRRTNKRKAIEWIKS